MTALLHRLKAPYPCSSHQPLRWSTVLFMAVAVTLIVSVLILNGYSQLNWVHRFQIGALFGSVCLASLILVWFAGRLLISPHLGRRWQVIHETIWILINFLVIGYSNMLVLNLIGVSSFDWLAFCTTGAVTLMVGLPPLLILILYRQNKLLRENLATAATMNATAHPLRKAAASSSTPQIKVKNSSSPIPKEGSLHSEARIEPAPAKLPNPEDKPAEVSLLTTGIQPQKIVLDNQEFLPDQFLFLEANRNYLRIVTVNQQDGVSVRMTMKLAEKKLAGHPHLLRCHRAFIVNFDRVTEVGGNSQGLLLTLSETEEQVPVSRAFVDLVRERWITVQQPVGSENQQ